MKAESRKCAVEEYVENNFIMDSGYINMGMFLELPIPFIIVIGPRGTGKTYTTYLEALKRDVRLFSVRRKRKQYELCVNPLTTPVKKPYESLGVEFNFFKIEEGLHGLNVVGKNAPVAFFTYVGNIRDMRGFDGDSFDAILLDEGIPELGERRTRGEGVSLLHAYETICRNREIEGLPPLKFLILANYDDAGSDLFVQLNIVSELYRLPSGKCRYFDKRGLLLFNTGATPISEAKRHTALYNLLGEKSEFTKMAIDNISPKRFNDTISLPYKELKLKFTFGILAIYYWKRGKRYYVSDNHSDKCDYASNEKGVSMFKMIEREFLMEYVLNEVIFESPFLEQILTDYIKL